MSPPRRWAYAVAAGLAIVLGAVQPAQAAEPTATGWWTSANVAPLGSSVGPDVPDGGLLVQAGPSADQPTAYGALLYQLGDADVPSSLRLTVSPNSVTTTGSALRVCPLTTETFTPSKGGAMSDAPPYDCKASVTATPAANGTYTFDVSRLYASGRLAVAVVPGPDAERVVLSKPDSESLTVTRTPSSASEGASGANTEGASADSGAALPALSPGAVSALQDLGSSLPQALYSAPASIDAARGPALPPSVAQATRQLGAVASTAGTDSSHGNNAWAALGAVLLVAVGGLSWAIAGRSAAVGAEPRRTRSNYVS